MLIFPQKGLILKNGGHNVTEVTDHLLDEGVVCGIHAGAERVETLAIAVVSRVSSGS